MEFRVRNRATGSEFTVGENESILDAALRQGRVFPYSCRDGACASCKADLVEGRVDYGQYQPQALREEEKARGKLLLCQAKPLEDVVIDAREIAGAGRLEIRILPCRVARLERLAHDVMALHLTLPQNQRLDFLAGQYIDVLLRDGRRRSFSLANPPGREDPGLEIHVRRVPDGRFTNHVFDGLKERDLLRFQGPLGTFFLRREAIRPAILMAGGTGFAPVKSMVEDAIARADHRPLHFFWGVRSLRDLYMHELARSWETRHPAFRYTPVLSEPLAEDHWDGATGWVHDAVLRACPDLSACEVYASGPPPMINAARAAFPQHGLAADSLYYDSFEFSTDPVPVASAGRVS